MGCDRIIRRYRGIILGDIKEYEVEACCEEIAKEETLRQFHGDPEIEEEPGIIIAMVEEL